MSISRTYPMPRRVALSVGLALIRWARTTARPSARTRAVTPSATAAAQPLIVDAELTPAELVPVAALRAGARAKAIRQHRVDRQVEREREQAMGRYLSLPRQL